MARYPCDILGLKFQSKQEFKIKIADYLQDRARSGTAGESIIYFDRLDENTPEDLKIVLAAWKQIAQNRRATRSKEQKRRSLYKGSGF